MAQLNLTGSTIGGNAGAFTDQDVLTPLTKNVSRVPVSAHHFAKAASAN